MAKGITMDSLERSTCKVVVDGKTYTMTQYKNMLKKAKAANNAEAKPKKKKAKKEENFIESEIKRIMQPITTLKSLSAYYDNAYRQWGKIGNEILENRHVRPHFVHYRVNVSELERLIDSITQYKNERAVFQYIEKLIWKIEDIKELIVNIMEGAKKSGYLQAYKNHEAINGKGRRLGLQTLANKSLKTIGQMEDAIEKLKKIVNDGIDPFEYETHISPSNRRRLGL
jgi:hypothetical protein